MKRGLQIVLGVLSLIPLFFGLTGLIKGAAAHLNPEHVTATIDSFTRYQSGFYLSLFIFLWWVIPNIEKHTTVFRILTLAIFIGGVGRLISWMTIGAPPTQMIAGTILELGAPLLMVWQAAVAKKATI